MCKYTASARYMECISLRYYMDKSTYIVVDKTYQYKRILAILSWFHPPKPDHLYRYASFIPYSIFKRTANPQPCKLMSFLIELSKDICTNKYII